MSFSVLDIREQEVASLISLQIKHGNYFYYASATTILASRRNPVASAPARYNIEYFMDGGDDDNYIIQSSEE